MRHPIRAAAIAAIATAMSGAMASADLIMYEGFNYPVPSNNPDPDGGVNGGNGLPATNVGGNPTGTSTGLRGVWGTTLDVVTGLSYSQGPNELVTTGGAGQPNNASWGTDVFPYRNMTTDPFISYRTGNSTSGTFGADGTTLFFSMLMKLNSNFGAGTVARFVIGAAETNGNMYIGANLNDSNTVFNWGISRGSTGAYASTGVAAAAGDVALLVGRYIFGGNDSDKLDFWVNPTLGAPLGAPQASLDNSTSFTTGGFAINKVNTRPDTANVFVVDEFRLGETYADVTPYTVIPEPATALGTGVALAGLLATRRRRGC